MSERADSEEAKLREQGGKQARAQIVAAKPGKAMKGGDPGQPPQVMWKVTLRVFPDDAGSFPAVIQTPYPRSAGGPPLGTLIGVLYDPKNHRSIAFDSTASTESWGSFQERAMERVLPPGTPTTPGPLVIAGGQVVSGGPAPAAPAPATSPPVAEQLEQLADLKERGVLTDAEFQAQKQKLLGG
jgi:hypothetical protein